ALVGWVVKVGLPVGRAGIVQIDEQVKSTCRVHVLDALHGGGGRAPVRRVGPIAIVVVGDLSLATGAAIRVVDIHDGDDDDIGPSARPHRGRGVADEPFGQALTYPARSGFPSVLAGLEPNPVARGRAVESERGHGASLAGSAEFQ